jgi:hypothetical protein
MPNPPKMVHTFFDRCLFENRAKNAFLVENCILAKNDKVFWGKFLTLTHIKSKKYEKQELHSSETSCDKIER